MLLFAKIAEIFVAICNVLTFGYDIVYLLFNVSNLTRKVVPFNEVFDVGFDGITRATTASSTTGEVFCSPI